MENFAASAAEAIAYRVLKERDPRLAAYSLKMAEADWRFAVAGMADPATPWTGAKTFQDLLRVTFDSENVAHEAAATGVLASVEPVAGHGGPALCGQSRRTRPDDS